METVKEYMSASPHTVGQEQTVRQAQELMSKHKIRHLPVLHGGKLSGLISERDVGLIAALDGVEIDDVTVEEAMSAEPYTVTPETALSEVVNHMITHKHGSAVVLEGSAVCGILTTIDALRALASRL